MVIFYSVSASFKLTEMGFFIVFFLVNDNNPVKNNFWNKWVSVVYQSLDVFCVHSKAAHNRLENTYRNIYVYTYKYTIEKQLLSFKNKNLDI